MVSEAMKRKKAFMSHLMKSAWVYVKTENLMLSMAMRKSWLYSTKLDRGIGYMQYAFDPKVVYLVSRDKTLGQIKIIDDGFWSALNRMHYNRIFKNRKAALHWALGADKSNAAGQLPLL